MVVFIMAILVIVGWWKIFTKAGVAGWKSIIPIYNIYVLITKIIGKPWWWLLLLCIPILNLAMTVLINLELAKAFGKGILFALGLTFLGFIFYPILGFGDSTYKRAIEPEVVDAKDYDL